MIFMILAYEISVQAPNKSIKHHTATYLGTLLTDTVDNKQEVINHIADSTRTCNRLKLFWNKTQKTVPWKIQVFHSILRSKLLYGLETIHLNKSELNRLDAFQIKGYRRILHIPPTSVDRTMTNSAVKELLNNQYGVTVVAFSKLCLRRKIQLLGHIIRADPQDPMRQVLFLHNSLNRRTEHTRRIGKPRAHWLIETYADAYKESGHLDEFDINNILHRTVKNDMAQERLNIFCLTDVSNNIVEPSHHQKFPHRKYRHQNPRHRKFVTEIGRIPGPAILPLIYLIHTSKSFPQTKKKQTGAARSSVILQSRN